MFLYASVSCVYLCLSDEPVLFCIYIYISEKMYYSHVWIAQGKINCKRTRSSSLNKVYELNLN